MLSHERIYQHIWADKRRGGMLYTHLRRQGKRYQKRSNGKAFAYHEQLTAELGATVYFARPYHSWERGLNENTNGLLRLY